ANSDRHVGSIWGYLCDDLLATRHWNRCIIAPIAQGSTTMHDWSPEGGMSHLIRETVEALRINGLAPSAMLYGQGEADASVQANPVAYRENFNRMVEQTRTYSKAPILVAVETICYLQNFDLVDTEENTRVDKWIGQEKIAQAQRSVIDSSRGVFAGPD